MLGNKGHLTAITRKKISAPMRYLSNHNFINLSNPNALDYGCGKGYDAKVFDMDKYDPYYYPEYPVNKYDIITCNYVLNVVEEFEQELILNNIQHLLTDKGVAYITVRRDIIKEGYTKRGTYQRNVILNLSVIKETSTYCIYKLEA